MNNIFRTAVATIVVLAAISLFTHSTSDSAITATTAPARHYYLTKNALSGNQALTACASGYHFASFAEINNPSDLTYNKTLGRVAADSGSGPPSRFLGIGWIRSGSSSNAVASDAFVPTNCSVWTSASGTDVGEIALFDPPSGQASSSPELIFGNGLKCDNSDGYNIGVWCIQN